MYVQYIPRNTIKLLQNTFNIQTMEIEEKVMSTQAFHASRKDICEFYNNCTF